MDLFHMQRYVPEDEEKEETAVGGDEQTESEQKILKQLKKRLKKKRKSEVNVTSKAQDVSNAEAEAEAAAAQEPEETPAAEAEEVGEVAADEPTKKKRKKKKSKGTDDGQGDGGFPMLGENMKQNRQLVRRVLPDWLARPDIVSMDFNENQLAVDQLEGLDERTVEDLRKNNITSFFPVQRQVIPYLLNTKLNRYFRPSDVCVSAPTGSGKTLAFVLPVVQSLRGRVVPCVRALVILPVQDLANQVFKVFHTYSERTGLKVKLLSAKRSFAQEQEEVVRRGVDGAFHSMVDIVVATPGRLVDHIQKTEGFSLQYLRYLIIDEADRVMEDVQDDWLAHVEEAVYGGELRPRPGPLNVVNSCDRRQQLPLQKLLFSATLSQNPEQLQQLNLFEPKLFTSVVDPKSLLQKQEASSQETGVAEEFAGQYTTPAGLSEFVVHVKDTLKKPLILHHMITSQEMKKVLVFTRTLEHTHSLAVLLKQYGLAVGELSSQTQNRQRMLNQLSSGALRVLVCSDALARGIDIAGQVDHVVSYDCPRYLRTYIHRVGRTARAGQTGVATTLVEAGEKKIFRAMMREAAKAQDVKEQVVDEDDLDEDLYDEAKTKAAAVIKEEMDAAKAKRVGRRNRKNKRE